MLNIKRILLLFFLPVLLFSNNSKIESFSCDNGLILRGVKGYDTDCGPGYSWIVPKNQNFTTIYEDQGGCSESWTLDVWIDGVHRNRNEDYYVWNAYDICKNFKCPNGQVIDKNLHKCVPKCGMNMHSDENGKCVCNIGYGSNDNGSNCKCYVGNSTVSYAAATTQQECESLKVVRVDGLNAYYKFSWNSCLNACVAQNMPSCSIGEVYNQDGQCVPATLDTQDCISLGGAIQNIRIQTSDACISNNGDVIVPCCQKVADCVIDTNPPKVISVPSVYTQCGDINTSNNKICATCEEPTPIPTDNGICTNADKSDYNSCPNPNNKCPNCPAAYPIADNYGDCKNSNGDTTICPIYLDTNYTAPYMCTTCSYLGVDWKAKDDKCMRTTDSGIVQISDCPSEQINTNNTTTTNNDTNVSNIPTSPSSTNSEINISKDINTRPNNNTVFEYNTTENPSTLGDNSGTQKDNKTGNKTEKICTNCPPGYVNSNGLCVLISTNGTVVSTARCPKGATSTVDTNKSDPLDQNGTDGNITGTMNELGQRGADQIKKAYKEYSIFPTNCGQLVPMKPIIMFNGKLIIDDPLIKFNDVMMPYRDLIKNFLIFIVVIIGLFDFFRRS